MNAERGTGAEMIIFSAVFFVDLAWNTRTYQTIFIYVKILKIRYQD